MLGTLPAGSVGWGQLERPNLSNYLYGSVRTEVIAGACRLQRGEGITPVSGATMDRADLRTTSPAFAPLRASFLPDSRQEQPHVSGIVAVHAVSASPYRF